MTDGEEALACVPVPVRPEFLNPACVLPYGLTAHHVFHAMEDLIAFLGFINQQLHAQGMQRLESFLMPANFSSIVGEFMNISIPKYCPTLVKNLYHNGHPDLIPAGLFPENAVQYSTAGIEVKGSRHASGWQGHNPEAVWLMVFHFDSNASNDARKGIRPKAFQIRGVYAAKLDKGDWSFSGRSGASRRTITASVTKAGAEKMKSNWVYRELAERQAQLRRARG